MSHLALLKNRKMDNVKILDIDTKGFENFPMKSELTRLSDKHSIGFTETHISEILLCKAETDINKLSELLKYLTSEYTDCAFEVVVLNLFNSEKYNYVFLNGKCHILHY